MRHSLTAYLLSIGLCFTTACSHKMEEVASGETESPRTAETASTDASSVPIMTNEAAPAVSEAAQKAVSPSVPRKVARFVVPQVRTRNGKLLNRYYFVRAQDTQDSVAQKLFGDASKKTELFVLDQGEWEAGRVVLYPSTKQPADNVMRSYFEDFGIKAEKYQVKSGESVSSIAEDLYDDAMSWKEISAANGMKNANRLEKGATLLVYPLNSGPLVAVNAPQAEAVAPAPAVAVGEGAPLVLNAPVVEEASVGVTGLLFNHWVIVLGGLSACLCLFFVFRNRDDEWDYKRR